MKTPPGARFCCIRGPGIIGQSVAAVVGDKAYLWMRCQCGGAPDFNRRPRRKFTVVREATPRETILGHVF